MNKRIFTYTIATALCFLFLFTIHPSIKVTKKLKNDNSQFVLFENNKKNAFATALFDIDMIEPTLVSLYSLNSAIARSGKTSFDIILLLSNELDISQKQLEPFDKLHAKITSFPRSPCIHLWTLYDYQKIVYFTPDIFFEKDVDQIFKFEAGSSIYSQNNTPLLLLIEPNPTIFESLRVSHLSTLSQINQQSTDYQQIIPMNSIEKIVHVFNGPVKPWNFHQYRDTDWSKQINTFTFYKWRRASNDIRHLFKQNEDWKNDLRQRTVCDTYFQNLASNNSTDDTFSVLISTYNPDRIEHVSLLIKHLLTSSMIHTIYVTWHNPNLPVPSALLDMDRVHVLTQTYDSLNNRFNPIDDLVTDAVYIMDDDIYIDIQDLEFTYNIWKNRRDSVVGHFPRIHSYNKETQKGTYKVSRDAPYSIVLTKSMFIRSDYLLTYTCLLDPKLHEYVDDKLNCEDIGFMMMTSGMTGVGSTYVSTEKPLLDMGLKKGISVTTSHMPARSQCVYDFITRFWDQRDPLVLSLDTISRFKRPFIKKGDWKRIEQ